MTVSSGKILYKEWEDLLAKMVWCSCAMVSHVADIPEYIGGTL